MPKANTIDTNWTAGEVSPLMRGRVDTAKYQNGAELIENFIVRPQGGLWKRSGTRFVRSTKLSSSKALLVPFEFSDETAYMLEFGAGYIHFYKDGKPLHCSTREEMETFVTVNNSGKMQIEVSAGNAPAKVPGWGEINSFYGTVSNNGTAALSSGTGAVIRVTTSVPHTLRTGCKVLLRTNELTAGGNATYDNAEYTVTRISNTAVDLQSTNFSVPPVGSNTAIFSHGLLPGDWVYITGGPEYPQLTEQWHRVLSVQSYRGFTIANMPYENNGSPSGEEAWTIPIEVLTDYTEADLEDLYFAQSADVLYICHPNHPPAKLTRLDTDGDREDWLLSDVSFTDGPYLPPNTIPPNFDSTTPANGARYEDVYLVVSSYSHTATATCPTGATLLNADDNRYLEYRDGDQWRLAQFGTLAGGETSATVTIIDNVLLHLDEAVRLTQTSRKKVVAVRVGANGVPRDAAGRPVYGSTNNSPSSPDANKQHKLDPNDGIQSDAAAAGSGKLKSNFTNTFGVSDVGKYVRYTNFTSATTRWALITALNRGDGQVVEHGAALTMAVGSSGTIGTTGNWVITSETRTCTVTAYRSGSAFNLFADGDVGRHIRLNFSGRWVWGKIASVTSRSVVTVTLYEDMPRDPHNAANIAGEGRCYSWRLGAWGAVGDGAYLGNTDNAEFYGPGYPSVVCFHEQRLCFASTLAEPQTVWMSVSGDFENFMPSELDSTVLDDNAVTYTIASSKANKIRWLESGPTLLIGTSGDEWQAKSTSATQEPITPSNIVVVPHTSHGSISTVRPYRVGAAVLFASRAGNKVREMKYDFGQDAFAAKDLTIISEHILRQGGYAYRAAYQREPHSIYWVLLNDGTLAGLTYDADQDVYAWHRHSVDGTIESIATLPSTDGFSDQLWMVVNRTINAATVRTVEVLDPDFYPDNSTDNDDMFFVDAGLTIEFEASTAAIEGLFHLEGETIEIIADGVRQATEVVTSGAVTSDTAGTKFQIGLPYTAKVRSLPPEGGSAFGASTGAQKTISKLRVRVLDSVGLEHLWHQSGGATISETFNTADSSYYTNTYEINVNQPYDAESQYTLQSSKPYPLNILSVTKVIHTHD